MGSALDHLEPVLVASYRRELEQDENVWRSLPFFAGALSLELTAIFQVMGHIVTISGGAVAGLFGLLAVLTTVPLVAVVYSHDVIVMITGAFDGAGPVRWQAR